MVYEAGKDIVVKEFPRDANCDCIKLEGWTD